MKSARAAVNCCAQRAIALNSTAPTRKSCKRASFQTNQQVGEKVKALYVRVREWNQRPTGKSKWRDKGCWLAQMTEEEAEEEEAAASLGWNVRIVISPFDPATLLVALLAPAAVCRTGMPRMLIACGNRLVSVLGLFSGLAFADWEGEGMGEADALGTAEEGAVSERSGKGWMRSRGATNELPTGEPCREPTPALE